MKTIDKNSRTYLLHDRYFINAKEGDTIIFEMPPFCTGDYTATVYIDNDGDPYITKSDDYIESCRGLTIKSISQNPTKIIDKEQLVTEFTSAWFAEFGKNDLLIDDADAILFERAMNVIDNTFEEL